MAYLIDFNPFNWREVRVRHIFLHHEAEVILQIPLNLAWPADKLILSYTSNGIYIVKSGYKVGIDFIKDSTLTEGTLDMNQDSRHWNYIHNIPVQPKLRLFFLKFFYRRFALNILSTSKNLQKRGLFERTNCVHCRFWLEDDRHALFECFLCEKSTGIHTP